MTPLLSHSTHCPRCGSTDTEAVQHCWPNRQPGPGELYWYRCQERDCDHLFICHMPEPPDGYEGDGVFARNH